MKALKWTDLILNLIYIALGLLFMIRPEGVERFLCYILAVAVAVIGLLYLIGYFLQRTDENGAREGNGFAVGILLIIVAIFIIVKQDLVISLVPFLFGFMVLIRGLMTIQGVFVMLRLGFSIAVPLVSGLLDMALGLFVMLYPFETAKVLFILIGVGLLVGGITGIAQELLLEHLIRSKLHEEERARDMEGAERVRSAKAGQNAADAEVKALEANEDESADKET